MRPIRLILRKIKKEIPADRSHFWGFPSLPEGSEYPIYEDKDGLTHPYTFLCQMNMADVAPYDVDNLLPHEGLLLFFAKIDNYLGHYDCDVEIGGTISSPEDVKVIYVPKPENLTQYEIIDEYGEPVSPPALKMTFSLNTPPLCNETFLLANPTHREWETWDSPYEDWKILLQVDSFEGTDFALNFMDCGVLDFLISPAALRARDFSQVRAIVLST